MNAVIVRIRNIPMNEEDERVNIYENHILELRNKNRNTYNHVFAPIEAEE